MGRARHAPELMNGEEREELTAEMAAKFRAIHALVKKIPRGRVLTYGQLAEMAGFPGGARLAGAAMKRSEGLPWQRVVGKAGPRRGRIAIHDPVGAAVQRHKLAAEGVPVSDAGFIDLSAHGWIEADLPRRTSKRSAPNPRAKRNARTKR